MFGTQPHEPLPKLNIVTKIKKKETIADKIMLGSERADSRAKMDSGDESFEGSEDDLVFSIEVLRAPAYKFNKKTRQKLEMLKRLHKKVDDDFLNKRVKPRLIVIAVDGANMGPDAEPLENKPWLPRSKDNVVINLNKYIAKYDYDIAAKVCTNQERRNVKDEESFKRAALFEILQICSIELTGGRTSFQSLWSYDGIPYSDLNDIPKDCKLMLASELPMHETSATLLKARRERAITYASDYATEPDQY
jgi:hypothetical protein